MTERTCSKRHTAWRKLGPDDEVVRCEACGYAIQLATMTREEYERVRDDYGVDHGGAQFKAFRVALRLAWQRAQDWGRSESDRDGLV